MPQLTSLFGQRLNQHRIGVAQHIHSNARAQIQKTSAVRLNHPASFALLKREGGAVVRRQNGRDHVDLPF
jgi:hypothetical protein